MARRRFALLLALLAGVALAGRVAYVLAVTRDRPRFVDEQYYAQGARQLAGGHGFSQPIAGAEGEEAADHPPLTIVALAPVAWLTDGSTLAMQLAVATAGAGVVVLTGVLGRALAGDRAGLLAAAIAAVYPNLWINDGLVMSEALATLLTAAAVLLAYRLARDGRTGTAAALGAACALAALARSELLLLVPVLALPAALLGRAPWPRRLRLAGAALAAAGVTVAPWVGYNLTRFHEPVFLSYGADGLILGSNHDGTYHGPLLGFFTPVPMTVAQARRLVDPSVDPAARASEGVRILSDFIAAHAPPEPADQSDIAEVKRRLGLDYLRAHLGRLPVVVAARIGRTWGLYRPFQMARLGESEGRPRWASLAGWWTSLLLFPLAAAGAVLLRRQGVAVWPVLAPLAVVTLVVAAFHGLTRYRAPAEVSIVVLAATALAHAVPRPGTLLDGIRGRSVPGTERRDGRATTVGRAASSTGRASDF